MTNKKQSGLSTGAIIAIVVGVVFIVGMILSSGNSSNDSYSDNSNIDNTGYQNSNYAKSGETITFSGIGAQDTISNSDKMISIIVSGRNNQISVSENTELVSITLSGRDNQISICNSHNAVVQNPGVNNQIIYLDC